MVRCLACLLVLGAGCGLVLEVDPPRSDAAGSVDAAASVDGSGSTDGMIELRDGSNAADGHLVDPEDASASDSGPMGPGDGGSPDTDAMPMCIASFESVAILCLGEPSAPTLRVDLTAHFEGCGCTRAIVRATDVAGLSWNISDEMLEGESAVFDETEPFILGGATPGTFAIMACCYDPGGVEVACTSYSALTAVCL